METTGRDGKQPPQQAADQQTSEQRASEQRASEQLAAQTAALVGDLTSQDRPVRRRLTGRRTGLARRAERLGALRARLSELAGQAAGQGTKAAGHGARAAGRGAQTAVHGFRAGAAWLIDQVLAMAPRLPVRDLGTLRRHYPGLDPDQLAEALIESAARMSARVGAAVGTWAVLPFLPGIPAEIAAETLTVVAIEVKLVAELHEVYGMPAPGGVVDRMTAYTAAWANRRGVGLAPAGVVLSMGSPLRRRLQRRLTRRATESAFSVGPLLTGALASALINRHETRRLGRDVRDDLRRRLPGLSAGPGKMVGWPLVR